MTIFVPMDAMNKRVLKLALPSILANLTVPLVGMVDIAVAGHLNASAAALIGGISVGSLMFDLLYWNFGFLRAGTGGMTAQALGRGDLEECVGNLVRGVGLAFVIAFILILLQWPFQKLIFLFVGCSDEVHALALDYFYIRIWAAPATLSLMAFRGWFIGMQDTVSSMLTDLIVNGGNILFSLLLTFGLTFGPSASLFAGLFTGLGFDGIAYGTVAAQYLGLLFAITVALRKLRKLAPAPSSPEPAHSSSASAPSFSSPAHTSIQALSSKILSGQASSASTEPALSSPASAPSFSSPTRASIQALSSKILSDQASSASTESALSSSSSSDTSIFTQTSSVRESSTSPKFSSPSTTASSVSGAASAPSGIEPARTSSSVTAASSQSGITPHEVDSTPHSGTVPVGNVTLRSVLCNGTVFQKDKVKRFFSVNKDLFVRSVCLIIVYLAFMAISAGFGDTLLASCSIMLKLLLLFSYFTDGFAFAGEALTGKYVGMKWPGMVRQTVSYTFLWSMGIAVIFIFIYAFFGDQMLRLLTADPAVQSATHQFMPWLLFFPLISCPAFTWDGIYTGATATKAMRDSNLGCVVAFFAVWFLGKLLLSLTAPSAVASGIASSVSPGLTPAISSAVSNAVPNAVSSAVTSSSSSAVTSSVSSTAYAHLLFAAYSAHVIYRSLYQTLHYRKSFLLPLI